MRTPADVLSDASDEALWRGVVARDDAALRAMYERYAPTMLGVGRAVLGDAQLAEDVLTRVWVEVWERPDRFDAKRGTTQTFLVLLMRSRSIGCVDAGRGGGRRRRCRLTRWR